MQRAPRGKASQLLHGRRRRRGEKTPDPGRRRAAGVFVFVPRFLCVGRGLAMTRRLRASAPPSRWSEACTCHFAQEPEPHPPDTCQAAAATPAGCPPLPGEPRTLSPSCRRSDVLGRGGRKEEDTQGPRSRRDPAWRRDAPPASPPARRTLCAPFPPAGRGGGGSAGSPGQRQVLGAAVLLRVLLRRRRRWRRCRGFHGSGSGSGGRRSSGGLGRHDALPRAGGSELWRRAGKPARARTSGHAPSSPDSRYKNNLNVP
jgi:hypothetical protein